MKKIVLITALAFLGAATESHADDATALENKQQASSVRRALRIKKALEILSKAGVLSVEEDNSIKIDNSVLDELRRAGIIKELEAKEGVVCVDGGA